MLVGAQTARGSREAGSHKLDLAWGRPGGFATAQSDASIADDASVAQFGAGSRMQARNALWRPSIKNGSAGACSIACCSPLAHSVQSHQRAPSLSAMPVVGVNRDKLFEALGQTYSE